MSFHESFWVTVGAAAPVIALAGVVSGTDAMRIRARYDVLLDQEDIRFGKLDRHARNLFVGLFTLFFFILGSQGYALQGSLASLALSSDEIPLWIIVTLEPASIFLLGLMALLLVLFRAAHQRAEQRFTKPS